MSRERIEKADTSVFVSDAPTFFVGLSFTSLIHGSLAEVSLRSLVGRQLHLIEESFGIFYILHRHNFLPF